jgi:hypothetical protein
MISQPSTGAEAIKILVPCYQLRVRQRLCQQQLEHRITEHVRILAVVGAEREATSSAPSSTAPARGEG